MQASLQRRHASANAAAFSNEDKTSKKAVQLMPKAAPAASAEISKANNAKPTATYKASPLQLAGFNQAAPAISKPFQLKKNAGVANTEQTTAPQQAWQAPLTSNMPIVQRQEIIQLKISMKGGAASRDRTTGSLRQLNQEVNESIARNNFAELQEDVRRMDRSVLQRQAELKNMSKSSDVYSGHEYRLNQEIELLALLREAKNNAPRPKKVKAVAPVPTKAKVSSNPFELLGDM